MLRTIDYIRYESYAVYEMLTPTQRLETAHAQIRIEVQISFAKPIVFFTTLPEAGKAVCPNAKNAQVLYESGYLARGEATRNC